MSLDNYYHLLFSENVNTMSPEVVREKEVIIIFPMIFLTGHCHQSSKRPTEDLGNHPRVLEQPAKKYRGIFCMGCFYC